MKLSSAIILFATTCAVIMCPCASHENRLRGGAEVEAKPNARRLGGGKKKEKKQKKEGATVVYTPMTPVVTPQPALPVNPETQVAENESVQVAENVSLNGGYTPPLYAGTNSQGVKGYFIGRPPASSTPPADTGNVATTSPNRVDTTSLNRVGLDTEEPEECEAVVDDWKQLNTLPPQPQCARSCECKSSCCTSYHVNMCLPTNGNGFASVGGGNLRCL